MIPASIVRHLQDHRVPFTRRMHRRAVSANELAAALHETGFALAKVVMLEVDQRRWIAMLPATEQVSVDRVAKALDAKYVRILDEEEFEDQFPGCEVGAEPPFGRLYGLPVIADDTLAEQARIWMRAGSHEECVSMAWTDFDRLEKPAVAAIGVRDLPPRMSPPTEIRA